VSTGAAGPQLRNLQREGILKPYAEAAFARYFDGAAEFEAFYDRLTNDEKDLFLGVASKYVFLVKHGDWHVDFKDCNPVIAYLTNSFKLVSMFSLIESLSSEKHEDFYEWLRKRQEATFPIPNKSELKLLHDEYKKTYGSIRRCIKFFERLPPALQTELRAGFKVRGQPAPGIKAVAEFLYNLRSKFVHEGQFVLEVASMPVMSWHRNAPTLTEISVPTLLRAFEEGLLAYFHRAT